MSLSTTVGRVVGFIAGLFLVSIGFGLFSKDSGLEQSNQVTALISVLIALGIGVIAASLLPNSITVEGKEVKPLGLGINATGGAGFFIITLIFLFYFDGGPPKAQAGNTEPPVAEVTPTPGPTASASPDPSAPPPAGEEPGMSPAPAQQPPRDQPQQSYYRVRTYCSICCPAGPANCPQVGFGEGASYEMAASSAVQMCVANNGRVESCDFNLEQY
jgi:hypothetical protein